MNWEVVTLDTAGDAEKRYPISNVNTSQAETASRLSRCVGSLRFRVSR